MTLADWLDQDAVASRLFDRGLRTECAANAAACFVQSADALRTLGVDRSSPIVPCWAPGRIEVLGKHTDYCGGESVLAAAERGFCMIAVARDDGIVRIVDIRRQDACEFPLEENLQPRMGHWSNYPQTVVRRLARNFPQASRGATIAFTSNLPASSGMSSSSAFVVGTFLLLAEINNLEQDESYAGVIRSPEDLAGYLSTVENGMSFGSLAGDGGVGTFGGSEDHTAILCGRPDRLVQYAFCPVRFQRPIELADDYVFAIASSGVIAEKSGAALEKYNRVSGMVRAIVDTWRTATNGNEHSLAAILASAPHAADRLRQLLVNRSNAAFASNDLLVRLEHFTTESQLIQSVPDSINATTIGTFGDLVRQSHAGAVKLLRNQTAETIRLVEIAEQLGARAASAFGAGFGGSVWALVERDGASKFLVGWQSRYQQEFPSHAALAEFFITRPGMGTITVVSTGELA
jgi:galactokinase